MCLTSKDQSCQIIKVTTLKLKTYYAENRRANNRIVNCVKAKATLFFMVMQRQLVEHDIMYEVNQMMFARLLVRRRSSTPKLLLVKKLEILTWVSPPVSWARKGDIIWHIINHSTKRKGHQSAPPPPPSQKKKTLISPATLTQATFPHCSASQPTLVPSFLVHRTYDHEPHDQTPTLPIPSRYSLRPISTDKSNSIQQLHQQFHLNLNKITRPCLQNHIFLTSPLPRNGPWAIENQKCHERNTN